MSEHDDRRISTAPALFEPGAYQLTADSQALMFRAHGHRRQAGDADIDRRLEVTGVKRMWPTTCSIDCGNEGQVVVGTSQRVDQARFERRAERQLVRLADGVDVTRLLERTEVIDGLGPMNATGVAASRIATTTTNASGPIGHSTDSSRRVGHGPVGAPQTDDHAGQIDRKNRIHRTTIHSPFRPRPRSAGDGCARAPRPRPSASPRRARRIRDA